MSHRSNIPLDLPALRALLTAALRAYDRAYPATRGLLVAEADADLRTVRLNLEALGRELGDAGL